MAKPVDKKLHRNYLQKAGEMLDVAQYALAESKYNAAVIASIHCSISAMDALAVFYFGKRHSGVHEQALDSVRGALSETEFKEVAKQFAGLVELKNQAEYQPNLSSSRLPVYVMKYRPSSSLEMYFESTLTVPVLRNM